MQTVGSALPDTALGRLSLREQRHRSQHRADYQMCRCVVNGVDTIHQVLL